MEEIKNYKIYGLVSSEFPDMIRYIGLTGGKLNDRRTTHKRDSKKYKNKKSNWFNKVIKDGFNVNIVLVEDGINNIEEIKLREIHYIKLFKSFGAKLVNGTDGGDFSGQLSPEMSKKMSESRKKKIDQYTIFGEFIKTFPSRNEAAIELNIEKTTISSCLKGECLAGGFIFSEYNKEPRKIENISSTKRRSIPIKVTNILTKEINYFKNITKASIYLNQADSCTRRYLITGNIFKNTFSIKYYNQC